MLNITRSRHNLCWLHQGSDDLRRRWGDTKRSRIEHALPTIVQSFKAHASAQIQARERRAALQRKFEEEQAARRREVEALQQNAAFGKLASDVAYVMSELERLQMVVDHLYRTAGATPAEEKFRDWCIGVFAGSKAKVERGSFDETILNIEEGRGY